MTTENQPQAGEAEQDHGAAQVWAGIEAEALELQGSAAQPGQAQQQAPSNTAAELLSALEMLRMMAAPLFADWKEFGQVWGDQTLELTAQNGGAIMDRHGWTMGGVMQQWGPYIGLVGALAMPSMATYQHLKLKRLEAERRAKEAGNVGHERASD